MKTLFTLRMFMDDMGSFTQPGCSSKEDALWHINSARDHDGLPHIDMEKLEWLIRGANFGWAKFTVQEVQS